METNPTGEQSSGRMRGFCLVIRVTACLVFALAGVFVVLATRKTAGGERAWAFLGHNAFSSAGLCVFAIVALGLAQFLAYLFAGRDKPGWILRHWDKALYLYAITLLAQFLFYNFYVLRLLGTADRRPPLWWLMMPSMILVAAKIVILIALGLSLRRIMSIIEESKTLV